MSMLTAQCDKLRETANEVKRIKDNNVDWLWRDAITLDDAVKEMREAADTIENLRNRLTGEGSETMSYASDALIDAQRNTINRLKTENENLRRAAERDASVMEALVSYIDDSRVDGLCRENEKLRELVNDMWICISHGSEEWDCTGCKRDPDSVCIDGISEFSRRMRELRIEVDE